MRRKVQSQGSVRSYLNREKNIVRFIQLFKVKSAKDSHLILMRDWKIDITIVLDLCEQFLKHFRGETIISRKRALQEGPLPSRSTTIQFQSS